MSLLSVASRLSTGEYMKYIVMFLILLSGCCAYPRSQHRLTRSGYPVYHRNMFVESNTLCGPCLRHQNECSCRRRHVKEPTYHYIYIPPVYKPVFIGVDERGDCIYERMLVRDGYYRKVFAGYRCWHCDKVLR